MDEQDTTKKTTPFLKRSLNIFIISFGWRNLFKHDVQEAYEKIKRDHLNVEQNHLFFFSWSVEGYYKKFSNNLETHQLKARLGRNRVLYDFLTLFTAPFIAFKHHFRPDVIVVYDSPFIFSALILKILRGGKICFFITNLPQNLASTRSHSRFKIWYYRFFEFISKRFVDHVFVINETTAHYAHALGIPAHKVHVFVPDTIKRDQALIQSSQKGVIRNTFNIKSTTNIILSVGRLEKEKGFDRLLTLFSQIQNDNLILIVVGEGSQRSSLESLAQKLGITDKVIFAGFVPREKIWNYYQDADVFVLLSRSEALGLVFWEAMYMGVPIIGSDNGGIVETIGEHEERGYFIKESDSATDLKTKLDIALNPLVQKPISEKAKKYVENKISYHASINDIINDYEK